MKLKQTNNFPDTDNTTITITETVPQTLTFHVRFPNWVQSGYSIKINGTEVFTCRADLSGKEVIEEYYINFGTTLESVSGETKIEVTYTDIHGNQQKGIFNISVTDVFFRNMSLN